MYSESSDMHARTRPHGTVNAKGVWERENYNKNAITTLYCIMHYTVPKLCPSEEYIVLKPSSRLPLAT